MLNLISLSMCGALSSTVVFTPVTSLQPTMTRTPVADSTHLSETVVTLPETAIQLADADSTSGNGDRRGAGRRN